MLRKNELGFRNEGFGLFPEIENFFRADPIFDFMRDFSQSVLIKTDIIDKGEYCIFKSELPGLKKEDIKVYMDGDSMVISADKKEDKEHKEEEYVRKEIRQEHLERRFNLKEFDEKSIDASYTDGVLTIKANKLKPVEKEEHNIEIK